MQKWRNILDISLISLLLSSCITSPDAPKLPRQPEQFTYLDEPDKWCRLEEDGETLSCAATMREYALYHVDDVAMVQTYIVELNERCEEWRVDGHSD